MPPFLSLCSGLTYCRIDFNNASISPRVIAKKFGGKTLAIQMIFANFAKVFTAIFFFLQYSTSAQLISNLVIH